MRFRELKLLVQFGVVVNFEDFIVILEFDKVVMDISAFVVGIVESVSV